MTELRFTVPGVAVATARARVMGGRASTPRKTVEYQSRVALACRAAMTAQGWETYRGRVVVAIVVFGPDESTDPDNVAKGVLDALVKAGALWTDRFRQIRGLTVRADESPTEPHVLIEVTRCS